MNNPYLDRIQVVGVRSLEGKGNLKAFAEIQLGETMIISGCRIIQQPGQRAYVAFPQNEANGKFYPIVTAVDKRFKEAVEQKVLAVWEAGQV
jgi:DNA-binding cell septation regulator SpoVG